MAKTPPLTDRCPGQADTIYIYICMHVCVRRIFNSCEIFGICLFVCKYVITIFICICMYVCVDRYNFGNCPELLFKRPDETQPLTNDDILIRYKST